MYLKSKAVTLLLVFFGLGLPVPAASRDVVRNGAGKPDIVFWREPSDIASRDLFYGPGGKRHQPSGPFTFVKEDLEASSPKFSIHGEDGVEWKVKLGGEARPETAATRLVWAVGYFTDEDYFLPTLRVANMPARLHRGQNLIAADGSIPNARLERKVKGLHKTEGWKWRGNTLLAKRELDGLRVMMSLINNWDLKDVNNAIYSTKEKDAEQIYVVSDLGASFGSPGFSWPLEKSRGNLDAYRHSKFIGKVTPETVDFRAPDRPALIRAFAIPEFIKRIRLRSIGREIPREHAKWIGRILGRLSQEQIRSAFRAAGYSTVEIEEFAKVVESRIAQLNEL